jgi:predicted nucleotidyltransferase
MQKSSLFVPNFSNQTMIDVLLFFLLHPDEEAYLARIVRTTNKALIQVQRTIKCLLKTGLIQKIKRAKKTFYKVDTEHLAFDDLRNMALKAKIWSSDFKEDRDRFASKANFGFIYGSIAKGAHTSSSDLDIFLIGNLTLHDVSKFMSHLGRELFREVNIVIYTPEEMHAAIEQENSFILEVIKSPKIWLFGSKNEFEKLYR